MNSSKYVRDGILAWTHLEKIDAGALPKQARRVEFHLDISPVDLPLGPMLLNGPIPSGPVHELSKNKYLETNCQNVVHAMRQVSRTFYGITLKIMLMVILANKCL